MRLLIAALLGLLIGVSLMLFAPIRRTFSFIDAYGGVMSGQVQTTLANEWLCFVGRCPQFEKMEVN